MAKGLDCGTSYYITAEENSIKKQRNVFLTVDGDANQVKRMLKRQKIPFVEKAGKVHIVGQHAFNYAQIFSTTELKRPMQSGLLNPKEKDALPILNAIIGELVGKAKIQKRTKSMVFLTCELTVANQIVATASGVWKILNKKLPKTGISV